MSETTDKTLLDLIRRHGPVTIHQIVALLGVTPTAVRNRLTRLVASGMVERTTEPGGRGRPKHAYRASVAAHKSLGQSYTDLALVLWDEMMSTVEDRKLRRAIFSRITERLAALYRSQMTGDEWEGRLVQLGTILHDRGIETEVTAGDGSAPPVLKQHSCPYYALAELDRAVCSMERKMFEKVLGRGLRLSQCRLDGHRSCDFEAKPEFTRPPDSAKAG